MRPALQPRSAMSPLPPYVQRSLVAERLPLIFPEGTPNRTYCIRELAASTVFTMLYIGAVDGQGRYIAPIHVYRMTEEQSLLSDPDARARYASAILNRKHTITGTRWYADNTREPIRDETLREGLIAIGAVTIRTDVPTTSSRPRYALLPAFADLFDPRLEGPDLETAIAIFQNAHLSPAALARISIIRAGAADHPDGILVTFPNRETRWLAPGPSSVIARSVVEVFAPRFLENPAVLWLSESGNKVLLRDDRLASAIGLHIEADRNLPDMILVDLGPATPLIVFVEIVATDGAVTPRRQQALLELSDAAGFSRNQIAFLTAYRDRQSPGFRRTVSELAWDSFAWFASEPERIIIMSNGSSSPSLLRALVRLQRSNEARE